MKKVSVLSLFIIFFALALLFIFKMRGNTIPKLQANIATNEQNIINDSVHTYRTESIQSRCQAEDSIFCAVERVVKCTLVPELDGCTTENVPAFILGKSKDVERPTEISFAITKLRPVPESSNLEVYTNSDCNAVWFGLCKGTVIYSLAPANGQWTVTNLYALEK